MQYGFITKHHCQLPHFCRNKRSLQATNTKRKHSARKVMTISLFKKNDPYFLNSWKRNKRLTQIDIWTLMKLHQSVKNKERDMLSQRSILLHDNPCTNFASVLLVKLFCLILLRRGTFTFSSFSCMLKIFYCIMKVIINNEEHVFFVEVISVWTLIEVDCITNFFFLSASGISIMKNWIFQKSLKKRRKAESVFLVVLLLPSKRKRKTSIVFTTSVFKKVIQVNNKNLDKI